MSDGIVGFVLGLIAGCVLLLVGVADMKKFMINDKIYICQKNPLKIEVLP